MFTPLLIPLALACVASSTTEEKISFDWKIREGMILETRLESADSRTTSLELLINGNPAHANMPGGSEMETTWIYHHRDEIRKVAEGRPVSVRREYLEIERAFEGMDQENTATSPVVGHKIGIDESGDEVELELPEDLELEERHEKALRIHADLGDLLPDRAVELEEEWELESDALQKILAHGHDLLEGSGGHSMVMEGMGPDHPPIDPERMKKLATPRAWEGTCRLMAVEEEGGSKIARVRIEAEREGREGDGAQTEQQGGAIMIGINAGDPDEKIEGVLRFDLTAGRILSIELEGEIDSHSEMVREIEMGTLEMNSSTTGTRTVSLTFTEVEKEEDR